MRSFPTTLFLALLLFTQCAENEPSEPTIVYETSFETISSLTDDGWSGWYTLAAESTVAGGDSCLLLQPQWLPSTGQIEKVLDLPDAQATYELTFWSKTESWIGEAYIIRRSPDSDTPLQSIELNTIDWEQQQFLFSPDLAVDEELVILFSAGGTEVASGNVYVDELQLKQMID